MEEAGEEEDDGEEGSAGGRDGPKQLRDAFPCFRFPTFGILQGIMVLGLISGIMVSVFNDNKNR